MGKAIVTDNRGDGLYRVKLVYNLKSLDKELEKLNQAQSEYNALLVKAINSLSLLENDASIAKTAMNQVIDQWKNNLINAQNEAAPIIQPPIPNDPETGLPWVDPDRSQEDPLLDLINIYRTNNSLSTLTRNDDLNAVCLTYLRNQAGTNQIGHFGPYHSTAEDRTKYAGYYSLVLYELLAYGFNSPDDVVNNWKVDYPENDQLLDSDITECGIAYKYAPFHNQTYLWCVLLTKPDPNPPQNVTYEFPKETTDPIKQSAENTVDSTPTLEKIGLQKIDDLQPDKLAKSVSEYAIKQNKVILAQQELSRMMAEKLERDRRITELTALKASYEAMQSVDCWCCRFYDKIEVGSIVNTAEIPGFYVSKYEQRYVMSNSRNPKEFFTNESDFNILPPGSSFIEDTELRYSTTLSDNALFYDICMEPGAMKWKPTWRYATIQSVDTSNHTCSIVLIAANSFMLSKEIDEDKNNPYSLNDKIAYDNVKIDYPPCNSYAFEPLDEVLVLFRGFDLNNPIVLGFRRAPVQCESRSWIQLGF